MGLNYSNMNVGSLFSSLNTSGSGFSSMNFMSEYSNIKSGSYGKLLKSYYSQVDSTSNGSASKTRAVDNTSKGYREQYLRAKEAKANSSSSTGASYQDKVATSKAKSNQAVSTSADNMVKSLDTLRNADTFKKNAAGNYNTDDIYKSVKSYVDSYNNTLDNSKNSSVFGVTSNVNSLKNTTSAYSKSLSEIGITVGNDGKLSINEDTFKKSDMSSVKSLFDKGSYGYSARTSAYMTDYYAKQAQSNVSTYSNTGAMNTSDLMSSYSSFV